MTCPSCATFISPGTSMSGKLDLVQIDYPSTDVDRMVHFFTEVLGRPLLFRAGPFAFVDLGAVRLYIRPIPDTDSLARGSIIYLNTDDVDKEIEVLAKRGAEVHDAPHKVADLPTHVLWIGFIRDPDGSLIGIMEERGV